MTLETISNKVDKWSSSLAKAHARRQKAQDAITRHCREKDRLDIKIILLEAKIMQYGIYKRYYTREREAQNGQNVGY